MMIVLFQILSRILQNQNPDGSWGQHGSREETSYAIIAVTYLASLPIVTPIFGQIDNAIQRGREYLTLINALGNKKLTKRDMIWAAKTSYGVESVCHSYVLAALNAPVPHYVFDSPIRQLLVVPLSKVDKFAKLYATLLVFKCVEEWKIKAWIIEGYLYMPELENRSSDVFDPKCINLEKYLELIPFSWISSNGLNDICMGAQSLLDMMTISMLALQIDEFFDGDLAHGDVPGAVGQLPKIIDTIFIQLRGGSYTNTLNEGEYDPRIFQQLAKFVQYMVSFPKIQNASVNDKTQLEFELRAFLLANTQQLQDNFQMSQEKGDKLTLPSLPYIKWVHNTGSEHFCGCLAFAALICLLGNGNDFLPTSEIKYIAQDCANRASVALRMVNDSGSLSRDRRESNLNSAFFPEFLGKEKSDNQLCAELTSLSRYEARCLATSFEELEKVCGNRFRRIYNSVRVFSDLCDCFREMYEQRKDLLQ